MAMLTLYEVQKTIKYRANICSFATFVCVILFLLTFIPPIIIVLLNENFMKGINTGHESPSINYNYNLLSYLGTDLYGSYITWSTFANHVFLEASNLRIPSATFTENDNLNQFNLNIVFPLNNSETITRLDLLLFYNYSLSVITKFKMESMIYIGYTVPQNHNRLQILGNLELVQNIPITFNDTTYETPIVNQSSILLQTYKMENILKDYNKRLIRTQISNLVLVWSKDYKNNSFTVNIIVNYSTGFNIYYYQTFWEHLKWFWIQYLAILIPLYWAFYQIKLFIFTKHLVVSRIVKDDEQVEYGTITKAKNS